MRLDGSRITLERYSITNCTLLFPNAVSKTILILETSFILLILHLIGKTIKLKVNLYFAKHLIMLYIFFSQYPYNRKGYCNVNIILKKNQKEIAQFLHDIPFDTTIQEKNIFILQQSKRSK